MILNEQYLQAATTELEQVSTRAELEKLRVKYLGRKSQLSLALKGLADLPPAQRAAAGSTANEVQSQIRRALATADARLRAAELTTAGATDQIDLTVPTPVKYGHAHPVTAIIDELVKIFWQMGYQVAEGPEVETEWYNFEALNMPASHPARDMQDTFYLEQGNLPRTHTSGVQVRWMEEHQPPIRIIAPGKVYRNEDEDARHAWMFFQVEGLVVDKGISLAELKGTLTAMMRGILGKDIEIRLRPSYFPYTEPSVELDATCIICGGRGEDCATCSGTGWLELGGAGMVHPAVLERVGINPKIYSGFAFGFGPDRIAIIKYGVPDIREFWRPDLRFLRQF